MKSPVLYSLVLVFAALCLFSPRVHASAQFLVEVDCPPWQNPNRPPPDIIIGSFIWGTPTMEFPMSMISDILKDIPSNNQNPLVVAIAPGIYNGTMTIRAANVTLIGCGADKTFLTDFINNGISQSTVTVSASDVTLEHMQIANHKNDAWQLGPNPPGGNIQAVALTVDRNTQRTIVRFSYIYGFQDTLQSRGGYLYMYNSTILGKTDFIFGSGVMYLENCTIEAIPGGGYITAPNGPQYQMYGIVIVNPLIITKMGYNFWVNQTWGFGRGWQNYPMATFINAVIDDSTYFTNARAWWNVGTQAPTASSSVCMSRFAEYGTKFLRNPPAVDWKIQHPQSCPNYTEPWVTPIIARDTMNNDEVIFYRKTNVLAGWNPVPDSTPKPPVVASSSGAAPAASSSAGNVFSSSAQSASSSAWWKVLSSSAAAFFSSAPAATSSSSSSIPPVIVTPTPIDDVLGTLIPLHGPASSYDAANVHTVSEALRDADLSGYLEQLAPNPSTELDDALFEWHLPFAFHIGGATTHTAYVSTNGNLQFGSGMHSYRFVPEPLPKGDGELLPLLSYLFTDLQSTVANEFYVATLGVEPRRAALLRVPSVTTPTSRGVTALDVLLFEGLDRIEIRYYFVHEFHEPVLIALQPPVTDDFVVLWNAKPLDARALKALNGSTIVFQPRAAFV